MGRRPIPIQKIEKDSNRRVTFHKRRSGLLKKAYELSILCNVDVALILFSPSGEVTCFEGPRSSIEDVITKFASSMEHDRVKCQSQKLLIQGELSRKIENEEMLQEASRKLNQSRNAIVCGTKRTSHGDLHHCIQQCLTEIADANCCLGVYEDTITTKPLPLQQVILMEHYIQTQMEIIGNWKMITSCGQFPISSPQFPIFWLDPGESILNRPEDRTNNQNHYMLHSTHMKNESSDSLDENFPNGLRPLDINTDSLVLSLSEIGISEYDEGSFQLFHHIDDPSSEYLDAHIATQDKVQVK